jgi:hypothetical protein
VEQPLLHVALELGDVTSDGGVVEPEVLGGLSQPASTRHLQEAAQIISR